MLDCRFLGEMMLGVENHILVEWFAIGKFGVGMNLGVLSDWSDIATWEKGLLNENDWKARLYITGLGYYEATINGKKLVIIS